MSSMYGSPGGMQDMNIQRASQACMSCRKQKRKCDKALPACALCNRMNRACDYTDATPPPTSEDFNALRMKLLELESRVNGGNGVLSPPTTFATPTSSGTEPLGQTTSGYPAQDYPWQGIQNRFPAIAFLDRDSFKTGGIAVPKPSVDIPVDVLEHLGNGPAVTEIIYAYFGSVHKWMPIVSQMRLTRNMTNPLWEAGPDLALLFLCMKLIISRPQEGIESSQSHIYISAKRFLALMEATGTISLLVLQAAILVVWYEYGQAIYPAAWMSAGWCVRYGNLLGISGHESATQLLGRPATWTEQEERRRTWWGVLVADRIVSIGSQGYVLTTQEPENNTTLPVNDNAWDEGEMSHALQRFVSSPIDEPNGPFPRLCQASVKLGKVLAHHNTEKHPSETVRFGLATELYLELSNFQSILDEEAVKTQDYLSLATPLALTYSALFALCEPYSCPTAHEGSGASEGVAAMIVQAVEGLKSASASVVHFAEQINTSTTLSQELDRVSPVIMDSLYAAAATYAWTVRESGDVNSQMALDSLRHCLRRLGTRWRNAAEYLRILEAQEFTYAVGGNGA